MQTNVSHELGEKGKGEQNKKKTVKLIHLSRHDSRRSARPVLEAGTLVLGWKIWPASARAAIVSFGAVSTAPFARSACRRDNAWLFRGFFFYRPVPFCIASMCRRVRL